MKQIRKVLLMVGSSLLLLITPSSLFADAEVIVTVKSEDIGNNLNLEAIISIFNKSNDLADLEKSLNDSEAQISNIDYNHDGELDYLRPIEAIERHNQIIILQAVLGDDLYYDIASIEILASSTEENSVVNNIQPAKVSDSNISEDNMDADTTATATTEVNTTEVTAVVPDENTTI